MPSMSQWAELIRALSQFAWPIVVLLLGLSFMQSFGVEIKALFTRITSLVVKAFGGEMQLTLTEQVRLGATQMGEDARAQFAARLEATGDTSAAAPEAGPRLAIEDLRLLTAGSASPTEGLHMLAQAIGDQLARVARLSSVPSQPTEQELITALEARGVLTPQVAGTLRDFYSLQRRLRTGVPADEARKAFESGLIILKALQAMTPWQFRLEGKKYPVRFDPAEAEAFTLQGLPPPRERFLILMNRRGELMVFGTQNFEAILPIASISEIARIDADGPDIGSPTSPDEPGTWRLVHSSEGLASMTFDPPVQIFSGRTQLRRLVVSLEEPDRFVNDVRRQMHLGNAGA